MYNRNLYYVYEQLFDCSTERCYIGGNLQIRAIMHGFATPLQWRVYMGEIIWIGILAAISGLLAIAIIALYIV